MLEKPGDRGPRKADAAVSYALNNMGHRKMYNTCTGNSKRGPAQLLTHAGEGLYSDKVALPLTHMYKGGNFTAGADGTWMDADNYIKHTWETSTDNCALQIVEDKWVRENGFSSMPNGVCPK